ncbi:MAG: hypothetical protein R3223_08875 [Longimicrobiales bacterium]|nr:hypothetical protein [Longimicrobiales bacterium]
MSRDPLPGEIRPPGAEPPGEGEEDGADGDHGLDHPEAGDPSDQGDRTGRSDQGFEPLRAHGKGKEPPGAGPDSIPDDEAGPIGIFPSWAWVYGTVIAWATLLILLLYVFTITFDFGAR